jgi:TPR repeat protein
VTGSAASALRERAESGELQAQYEFGRALLKSNGGERRGEALVWLRRAADAGHVDAAFVLGWSLESDANAETRAPEMVHYYTLAAQGGHGLACSNLGLCYERGDTVPVDFAVAVDWYRKGAACGAHEADFRLALAYEEQAEHAANERRKTRLERAAALRYERAAKRGMTDAAYNLAICYFTGSGVPTDAARAIAWLERAGESGDADAQYRLARALQDGEGAAVDHRRAIELLQRAAEQQHPRALTALGWAYRDGRGVAADPARAVEHFGRAAEMGDAPAQCFLGESLARGDGIPRDDTAAAAWLRRAAEQGEQQAHAYLGLFYLEGRGGIAVDAAEGFQRVRAGADLGLRWAQARLGWCYWNGLGVSSDRDWARTWFARATANGLPEVAVLFAQQPGIDAHDIEHARAWLTEAARKGDAKARFWKNRLWLLTHPRATKWMFRVLFAMGYAALAYHLVTAPFRFEWLAVVWFLAIILLVLLLAIAAVALTKSERELHAVSEVPVPLDDPEAWRSFWELPAEDGVFLLPLLYVGATPFTALVSGVLFALFHLPNYPLLATIPKGAAYFLVGLVLLPKVGIWPIIVGHLLIDGLVVLLRRSGARQ